MHSENESIAPHWRDLVENQVFSPRLTSFEELRGSQIVTQNAQLTMVWLLIEGGKSLSKAEVVGRRSLFYTDSLTGIEIGKGDFIDINDRSSAGISETITRWVRAFGSRLNLFKCWRKVFVLALEL